MVPLAHRDLTPLRWLASPPVLLALALLLSLGALLLVARHAGEGARPEQLSTLLLAVNALAALILLGVLAVGTARLVRRARRAEPGSRLTLRLAALLGLLAVTPVVVVFFFSLGFIDRALGNWMEPRVDTALEEALEVSRAALTARTARHLRAGNRAVRVLARTTPRQRAERLDDLRRRMRARELVLLGGDGRPTAVALGPHEGLLPDPVPRAAAAQARAGIPYLALEPRSGEGLQVRLVYSLPGPGGEVLQALFPLSGRLGEVADRVQTAWRHYRGATFLREPLRTSFVTTLTLVVLLAGLAALWAALLLARRLVAPIRDLAAGTRAVAAGDYTKQLPIPRHGDEIAGLVESFNEMTTRVAESRDSARRSQRHAEAERTYLEAVLGRLSSGVLTLDREGRLLTANRAATSLLEAPLRTFRGRTINTIAGRHPHLEPLAERLGAILAGDRDEWSDAVTLFTPRGRRILTLHGSRLPEPTETPGHILVFDDVTALVQAQKEAAWGEVARRLAHEIKNPLTPIRLAADRLRMKCADGPHGDLVERSAGTIIHQVEGLEEMVRAFADYARTPPLAPRALDLNELVREVLELFRGGEIQVLVNFDPGRPRVHADPDRLRRVLTNLLENARTALQQAEGHPRLSVTTRCPDEGDRCRQVELRIQDSGPGVPAEERVAVFEPYHTSREGGTGLGLAIAKKLVEENGGRIHMEGSALGGACVVVTLPADGGMAPAGNEEPS
ncbi:MAG: sensor histidine kinase [Thiohalospira sp.]